MPTIPIYIRKDDYAKFLELYSPEWLHEILNEGAVLDPHTKPQTIEQVFNLKPEPLESNVEPDEPELDYLDGLVYDSVTNMVYDKDLQEPVEADATMIKQLKKRGRVV